MPPLHDPLPIAPDAGFDFFCDVIRQNQLLSHHQSLNGWEELKRFCSFSENVIWSFAVAQMMRWRIRRNPKLKHILQFDALLPVRNNIEKGSFAYDTLLFNESTFSLLRNRSHLANLVCLAILFGDEFLDGIAKAQGKEQTGWLISSSGYNFNLQHRRTTHGKTELYYEFDICTLIPQAVLNTVNEKYKISYAAFYRHLLFLLAEMNVQLAKLGEEMSEEAGHLVCKVCNRCFETYRHDVSVFNDRYTLAELTEYQRSKDDDIVMLLLNLRAELLGKRKLQYQKEFMSWSSIIRSMQLYDDMEDAAVDCDYQMNMCCWLARSYFPEEWDWLQAKKYELREMPARKANLSIALHMSGSCMLLVQYARNISLTKLSWVQQKIVNYLWRKNWLGFNDRPKKGQNYLADILKGTSAARLQLRQMLKTVSAIDHELLSIEMKKAWVLDIALMDPLLRTYVLKRTRFKDRYMLKQHFLQWSIDKKAALLDSLL